jgi:hypothetical protein
MVGVSVARKKWWSNLYLVDSNDRRFVIYGALVVLLGTSATFGLIQFESLGVGKVAIAIGLFFSLLFVWVFVYERGQNRGFPRPSNVFPVLWAFGIGAATWIFGFQRFDRSGGFAEYPFFPLDTIDASELVGKDTIFHVTLMNSIINFGYPSTGLNDAPLFVYHTLSHYLESGMSIVSGISPIDTLGLFYGLKIVVLLAGMLFFLYRATKNHSFVFFLLSIALVIPVLTSRWVITWSLSLWLPSFILLATAFFIYKTINSSKPLSHRTFVAIGIIGVVLSLGKLSSGFFFMLVAGLHLLFNFAKDRRVYVLGVLWFVFLVVYGLAVADDRSGSILGSLGLIERIASTARMVLLLGALPRAVFDIYILLAFLAVAFFLFRRKSTRNLLVSLSIGFMATCAMQFLQLNFRDIRYFHHGLFFIVFVLTVIDFFQIFGSEKDVRKFDLTTFWRKPSLVLGVIAVVTSLTVSHAAVKIPQSSKDVFSIQENVPLVSTASQGPQLTRFRAELDTYMSANDLTDRASLLFIPLEMWTELAPKMPDIPVQPSWVNPLLIYSITGVPLINGVFGSSTSYGFSAYSPSDAAIPQSQFLGSDPCRFGKYVIEVKSWSPSSFEVHCTPVNG